jgi:N utilization substance protein B
MAIPQQKLREIVFLLLFARVFGTFDEKALEELIMEQLKVSKSHIQKCWDLVRDIESKYPELDQRIRKLVVSYDFERIQSIEKTALRLGAYELLYNPSLPLRVAIAEALRLTKKFGSPSAVSFVNAILDGLTKVQEK